MMYQSGGGKMSLVKILPQFKTSEERNLVALAIGLTLLFGGYLSFVPPLIVYFCMTDKLSDSGKHILRQFINFMINVAVIVLILTVSIIGIPLVIVVGVGALVFVIIDLLAVLNNSEVSIPVFFEALKESSDMTKSDTSSHE